MWDEGDKRGRPLEYDSVRESLRRYISHWAFLPLSQFSNDDSLRALRKDFGMVSKMGMLVDAVYPRKLEMEDGDMDRLDTVEQMASYLESKGCLELNPSPEGCE